MISGLYGQIFSIEDGLVEIDCAHGIIYSVFSSTRTIQDLVIGSETSLKIEELFSETSHKMYGFYTKEELLLFKVLGKVHRVGPNIALLICGEFSLEDLATIVGNKDLKKMSSIKGLGVKSATTIINHLDGHQILSGINVKNKINEKLLNSIKLSLKTLGFKTSKYNKLLNEINNDLSLEENIKIIVKRMK